MENNFNFTHFMDAEREQKIIEEQKTKHPDLYSDPKILEAAEEARKEPVNVRRI